MILPLYLAMTGAEISANPQLPSQCAYMACHFSPYDKGLSNFPKVFPRDAMLILNDQTPVQSHDPDLIAHQLSQWAKNYQPSGLLLDLQRPENPETLQIVQAILETFPFPVGVSHHYAKNRDCPVFLPAVPLNCTLASHISPWQNREVWLEVAMDALCITVHEKGSRFEAIPYIDGLPLPHYDEKLHCSYKIETLDNAVEFTLQRTFGNLEELLQEAADLGITKAVGFYQELCFHVATAEHI